MIVLYNIVHQRSSLHLQLRSIIPKRERTLPFQAMTSEPLIYLIGQYQPGLMRAHAIFLLLVLVTPLHLYPRSLLNHSEILCILLMVLPLFLTGRLLQNLLAAKVGLSKIQFKIELNLNHLWSGMTRW